MFTYQNPEFSQSLFSRIASPASLYNAWRKVRANRGAPGVDAINLHVFEAQLMNNLQELSRSLLSHSYQPLPARFVSIAKPNGKERELAILTVRDRVGQRSTLDNIEPLFEPQFLDCNFAFRPERSVEMAIQRIIAARANGYWWTVESDVENFFGSIDRKLLLTELSNTIADKDVQWLLNLWLEAGALDPQTYFSSTGILHKGKQTLADLQLLLKDTANRSLDEYVNDRLVISQNGLDQLAPFSYQDLNTDAFPHETAKHHKRREVLMQFLKDGALLALSHRAAIAKLLGLKLLGAGGLAVTAAFVAPKIVNSYRNYFYPHIGTLQGAPISPLLTNAFMTPFDAEITGQGWRLIRYCDDFVIQCRSEEESRMALQAATEVLQKRKLRLHPDKTRIVPPHGDFEFLGYVFEGTGRVIPPPSVPLQMARKISSMAHRAVNIRRRTNSQD
jgi:retron-type reverse transcriptase